MNKSNSNLAKAINEADTIKAGALRNANDLLIEQFRPKIKNFINSALNEQALGLDETVPSDFDPSAGEDGVENPQNTINVGGGGIPLTEQEEEDLENPEDIVEQDNVDFDDEEIVEQEDINLDDENISEQEDIDLDDEDISEQDIDLDDEDISEQEDIDLDDEDISEQVNDFNDLDDDAIIEIDDEELDDDSISEEDDKDVTDDEDDIDEDVDVNSAYSDEILNSTNESRNFRKLKIEYRNLKRANANLKRENAKYNKGILILRKRLQDVNLFNEKLSYSMKVINNKPNLSQKQKRSIVEQFDNCKNIREVKITFNAINKFSKPSVQKTVPQRGLNESTRRIFRNINENRTNKNSGNDSRMMQLAGL